MIIFTINSIFTSFYNNDKWIKCVISFVATIATKLRLQGVSEFELSPGPPPFTVAAYVPGAKVILFFLFCVFYIQ